MEIIQYEVYWVNLDPTIGKEMKKTRPCVVLSPNEMNAFIGTIIIAPLTSTLRSYSSRVNFTLNGNESMIAIDQLKTIDKKRIGSKVGKLDAKTVVLVKQIIDAMLVK
jgi:mRNA interferase MazF